MTSWYIIIGQYIEVCRFIDFYIDRRDKKSFLFWCKRRQELLKQMERLANNLNVAMLIENHHYSSIWE